LGLVTLILSGTATAGTRLFAVYNDGRLQPAVGKAGFSCDDSGLAFVFSETVDGGPPPEALTLEESSADTAHVTVRVQITQSCGDGDVTFSYGHDSDGGTFGPGGDLNASPQSFALSMATMPGATDMETVNYQAVDDAESEDAETFTLFGDQIVFFVGNTAGQASDRRDLASITIPANDEKTVDPNDLPDGSTDQQRNAIERLNNACAMAEPNSALADTCEKIHEYQNQQNPQERSRQARRIADALNPQVVVVTSLSALQTGRIQHENIVDRLVALHQGAKGISLDNVNLSLGGLNIGTGWLNAASDDYDSSSRLLGEKWGLFLDGSVSLGNQDRRITGPGFDFDAYSLTAGLDYRFDSGLILGGAVGFDNYSSDLDGSAGGLDSNSKTLQGFGTYNFTDRLYVDLTAAYTSGDLDQDRVIDLSGIGGLGSETARGSTNSDQTSASVALNYDTSFSPGWSATAYGSLYFADTTIDAFSEQGSALALSFEEQNFQSLLSSLGVRVTKVVNLSNGVLTPFADVAWQHESKNDSFEIKTRFVQVDAEGPTALVSEPDRDFGRAAVGASWVFPSGNQVFFRVNSLLLDANTNRYSVYVGGRFEF